MRNNYKLGKINGMLCLGLPKSYRNVKNLLIIIINNLAVALDVI
jgi:hypothetical protein